MYDLYSQDVFRYSLSILENEDEAKDAVQETFLRYYENENKFRGDASYKTWLFVIARNYCYSRLKRKENHNLRIDNDAIDLSYIHNFEITLTIEELLKYLTPEQNEIFFLKFYGKYSNKEVAQITGYTPGNVSVIIYRIRELLRKKMEYINE